MNFESHRPQGYIRKGDRYLPQLAEGLKQMLIRAQESLAHNTLYLPSRKLEELATVLVEFAEDIHNDIGIWNSLERYNIEFFGTPLPFVEAKEDVGQEPVNEQRVQHLLWVLYSELNPQLILSPTHRDLKQLSETASGFLKSRFAKIPRGSSVKKFLSQPNKFGFGGNGCIYFLLPGDTCLPPIGVQLLRGIRPLSIGLARNLPLPAKA